MITKSIWEDFKEKNESRIDDSGWIIKHLNDDNIAFLLTGTILLTPFSIFMDIMFLPFEIIYEISYKIITRRTK